MTRSGVCCFEVAGSADVGSQGVNCRMQFWGPPSRQTPLRGYSGKAYPERTAEPRLAFVRRLNRKQI